VFGHMAARRSLRLRPAMVVRGGCASARMWTVDLAHYTHNMPVGGELARKNNMADRAKVAIVVAEFEIEDQASWLF
jgi:hypothetical protein